MPVLFTPELHEPLADGAWSDAAARDAIARIVDDTLAAQRREGLWPVHPDDADAGSDADAHEPFSCWYFGGAGVLVGLDHLARTVGTATADDVAAIAVAIREQHAREPELEAGDPSPFLGTAGVELAIALATGAGDAELARVVDTFVQPALDLRTHDTINAAGAAMSFLLAVRRRLGAATAAALDIDARITAALRAELDTIDVDAPSGAAMWNAVVYGNPTWYVGAGHGSIGNVHAALHGADVVPPELACRAREVVRDLLLATAQRDGALANWLPVAGRDDLQLRVQWCHGAPGVLTGCWPAATDDDELRELLLAGAELTWTAGPLAKGASVCHGTAGSAHALLAAFDLTGDELWLDRARQLAMHAVAQVDARRAEVGRGRYSLWTGDLGVATCLERCVAARSGIVGLDLA